jgi:flagellar motor switch protein FliN/FliY
LQEAKSRVSDESKSTAQDAAQAPPADDASKSIDQAGIEALLDQSGAAKSAASPAKPSAAGPSDVEGLLDDAQQALASIDDPPAELPAGMKPFELRNLTGTASAADAATLDLLRDVQLDLKIELGRTHMQLDEVLQLKKGAVVTLDKLAGDPVDIIVNGRLIARGEVLVLNDNFCVRVAELVASEIVPA